MWGKMFHECGTMYNLSVNLVTNINSSSYGNFECEQMFDPKGVPTSAYQDHHGQLLRAAMLFVAGCLLSVSSAALYAVMESDHLTLNALTHSDTPSSFFSSQPIHDRTPGIRSDLLSSTIRTRCPTPGGHATPSRSRHRL